MKRCLIVAAILFAHAAGLPLGAIGDQPSAGDERVSSLREEQRRIEESISRSKTRMKMLRSEVDQIRQRLQDLKNQERETQAQIQNLRQSLWTVRSDLQNQPSDPAFEERHRPMDPSVPIPIQFPVEIENAMWIDSLRALRLR